MRVLMSLAFAAVAAVGLSGCQTAMIGGNCDSGCGSAVSAIGGSCADGSCGTGTALAGGGVMGGGGLMGGGACADGSCGVAQTGGLLGGLFSRHSAHAGYHANGCGIGGCGAGGHLCGKCRALAALRLKGRAAANHPYGGMTPHTPPMAGPHGPMSPHYGYPYYTTRGPRDFFESNPSSLGR